MRRRAVFQGFEEEVSTLPGGYDVLLVAQLRGVPDGCVGEGSKRPQFLTI